MKVLEKQKGIVFDSSSNSVSAEGIAAKEYQKAIEQGATHEQAEAAAPWPQPKPRQLDVDAWAYKRWKSGKPLDKLTHDEMTPSLQAAGFKPDI